MPIQSLAIFFFLQIFHIYIYIWHYFLGRGERIISNDPPSKFCISIILGATVHCCHHTCDDIRTSPVGRPHFKITCSSIHLFGTLTKGDQPRILSNPNIEGGKNSCSNRQKLPLPKPRPPNLIYMMKTF